MQAEHSDTAEEMPEEIVDITEAERSRGEKLCKKVKVVNVTRPWLSHPFCQEAGHREVGLLDTEATKDTADDDWKKGGVKKVQSYLNCFTVIRGCVMRAEMTPDSHSTELGTRMFYHSLLGSSSQGTRMFTGTW